MKARGGGGWSKNNAEGSCSRQFCFIQVEESNQVRVLRLNATGHHPKPYLFTRDTSEALRLNDQPPGSAAAARTLVSKLPNQISPTPTVGDLRGTNPSEG